MQGVGTRQKLWFLIQVNLSPPFTWIRNRPQMLVYKHEMHFGVSLVMSRSDSCFAAYFRSTLFRSKRTQKDLKLEDWSKRLLVQSIGVKPPNATKKGISMKT